MSTSLNIKAYAGKNSIQFKRHYEVVAFCIEKDVSFPKETEEFFKGKVNGENLEDYTRSAILPIIQNGVEVQLPTKSDYHGQEIKIKTADIPKEVDEIIVRFC